MTEPIMSMVARLLENPKPCTKVTITIETPDGDGKRGPLDISGDKPGKRDPLLGQFAFDMWKHEQQETTAKDCKEHESAKRSASAPEALRQPRWWHKFRHAEDAHDVLVFILSEAKEENKKENQ